MADVSLQDFLGAADSTTTTFLTRTYPAMAGAVAEPIYLAAILYWALYGYRVYAGHSPLAWRDFLAKAVMTVAVFGTLNWGGFANTIYQAFVSFMNTAAGTLMAGRPVDNLLDALFTDVDKISATLRKANFYQWSVLLDGFLLFVLNCVLFIIALGYMTIAKFGLAITMALLPLFVGFFFFEQTRHWATNWVNMMLTFALLYILVVAIVSFGFVAYGSTIDAAKSLATNSDTGQLLIIEGVLIVLLGGVRGWAAALAGGAMSSTGVLMMVVRAAVSGRGGRK